MIDYYGRIT